MKPVADVPLSIVPPSPAPDSEATAQRRPTGLEIAARDEARRKAERAAEAAERLSNPGAWLGHECEVAPRICADIRNDVSLARHPVARSWAGDPWSLTLLGTKGTGKSYLACLILARLAAPHPRGWSSSWRGLWVEFADAFDRVRLEIGKDHDGRTLDAMLHASVLVIDDVGADRGARQESSAFRMERLGMVLRHRYNHLLPTIITANLDRIADIAQGDERIEDRLGEGLMIRLDGPSLRPRNAK